jgi:putative transcriptional regulator
MKTTQIKIDPNSKQTVGHIDIARVDATTDADIASHEATDAQQSMQDAAQFARQVRQRMGLSQAAFAQRIDVSLETIRNWEQGKRRPTGAAKALLRLLDKAPELALQVLH